jgi:hypothetical protein
MIKLGSAIPGDAVKVSEDCYLTNHGMLSKKEFLDLNNRYLRKETEKNNQKLRHKFFKKVKKIADHMIIVGHSAQYAENFITEQMSNYDGRT